MREYIGARRQTPLLLTGSWILNGKSDDGKKIEMPRIVATPIPHKEKENERREISGKPWIKSS